MAAVSLSSCRHVSASAPPSGAVSLAIRLALMCMSFRLQYRSQYTFLSASSLHLMYVSSAFSSICAQHRCLTRNMPMYTEYPSTTTGMWLSPARKSGACISPRPMAGTTMVAVSVRTTQTYIRFFLYRYVVSSNIRKGAFFSSSLMRSTAGLSTRAMACRAFHTEFMEHRYLYRRSM